MSVGQQLLDVPFPEMVFNLASAIAEAQVKLDKESVEILRLMGSIDDAPVAVPVVYMEKGNLMTGNTETSMIGAGFQPTFYQFAETIIEIKMAITMTLERTSENKVKGTSTTVNLSRRGISVKSTPVDATYSSKYNFSQEGSSSIRTRLVPVPPDPVLQKRIEMCSEAMSKKIDADLKAMIKEEQ